MAASRSRSPFPALVLVVVLALAAAFAPAYLRAAQTLAALQDGDEAAIASHVDIAALRADLKRDVARALDAHYDESGADAAAKSIAAMIVAPFAGAIIDQFASPEALARVTRAALEGEPRRDFPGLVAFAAARGAFASWDAFRVRLDDGENATVLQFGRRNGLDWRLVGVDLPADALTR
ncbi:MAG: DUF2939 domain-containing protein [Alphaproteobacteria bacterium]|nr:DUF2939 domain-containing protein [Alphaproteobacteria bacterium]